MIDLEARASDILRADPAVTARVADRCWLTMPAQPRFPAILLRRVSGAPTQPWQGPRLGDDATFDLHAYGGSRVEALGLAQDAIDALCAATDRLGCELFSLQRFPDSTMPQESGRDRERYIASVRVWGR